MLEKDKERKMVEKRFYKTIIAIPAITASLATLIITADMVFNNFDPAQQMFLAQDYLLKFIFLLVISIPINLILILIACFGFIIFSLTQWPSFSSSNVR
jgi:hypothetical protein